MVKAAHGVGGQIKGDLGQARYNLYQARGSVGLISRWDATRTPAAHSVRVEIGLAFRGNRKLSRHVSLKSRADFQHSLCCNVGACAISIDLAAPAPPECSAIAKTAHWDRAEECPCRRNQMQKTRGSGYLGPGTGVIVMIVFDLAGGHRVLACAPIPQAAPSSHCT